MEAIANKKLIKRFAYSDEAYAYAKNVNAILNDIEESLEKFAVTHFNKQENVWCVFVIYSQYTSQDC